MASASAALALLSPSHIPVVPTMKRYKSLKLHQVDREDGHPWKLSSLLYPLIILSCRASAAEKKLKDHIAPNILENS